ITRRSHLDVQFDVLGQPGDSEVARPDKSDGSNHLHFWMSDICFRVKFLLRVDLALDSARTNALNNRWDAVQEIILLFLFFNALIEKLLRALLQAFEKRLARAGAHFSS